MKKIGRLRISAVRNESFKNPKYAIANIGESIQSVAISQLYKMCGVDESRVVWIDQCDIKNYHDEEIVLPLRLPLSKENVDEFLPLDTKVHPFFISLHLHDDIFENRPDLVAYFKKFEPIGCRDEISCSYFVKYGIKSYVMGCYTLSFDTRKKNNITKKIYIVDGSDELMRVIPKDIVEKSEQLTHAVPYHTYPVTSDEDKRLETLAGEYLNKYREAKLVITSRLHVAAPCIAMGVPVILAINNADFRYAWIDRFIPIYQYSEYNSIDWKPETVNVDFVRLHIRNIFNQIINNEIIPEESLRVLDEFFRSRNRSDYYKLFRERLKTIDNVYDDNKFTYVIWGAGNHSSFAYQLMSEMYPNARLIAIVDRFKTGEKFGVKIIHGDEITKCRPDHICVSTRPGLDDAIRGCKELYGDKYTEHCTMVFSQQES